MRQEIGRSRSEYSGKSVIYTYRSQICEMKEGDRHAQCDRESVRCIRDEEMDSKLPFGHCSHFARRVDLGRETPSSNIHKAIVVIERRRNVFGNSLAKCFQSIKPLERVMLYILTVVTPLSRYPV